MTGKIAKSVKLSAIVALFVFMAMGMEEFYGDNQAYADLYEFERLLDEIGAEVESANNVPETIKAQPQTIPVENIDAQIAYLEAFDEVIRAQIHRITRIFP